MRLPALALIAAALAGVGGAHAQEVQTSAGPDSVAVTIYRAPFRDSAQKIDLGYLGGYALITETRTVTIPPGRAVIRFEGVASGILPESAIVTGLPAGVREKNLDGELLSASSLYNRGYARPVTLRRTRDGKTVEERAIIRSGPDGAAIVETERGIEVLNCGPTEDAISYDGVPPGLSARPTLSVETVSPQGGTATLTLSYLAWGFDWQANYVATLRDGGGTAAGARTADLFAWVTLASTDMTSFVDAETMVVAGKVNRTTSRTRNPFETTEEFEFLCYLPEGGGPIPPPPPPPPPPSPPPPAMAAPPMADAVVVTGARMRVAQQEDLGDLKAYRIPDRTTVAGKAQKQVAMLAKDAVPVQIVYGAQIGFYNVGRPQIIVRAMNKTSEGLGLPLPAGPVALFEIQGGRSLLIDESSTDDKAIGEEVEIKFDPTANVTVEQKRTQPQPRRYEMELVVRNANPFAIRFEGEFDIDPPLMKASVRLGKKDGRNLWAVTVPANGSQTLRYRVTLPDPNPRR